MSFNYGNLYGGDRRGDHHGGHRGGGCGSGARPADRTPTWKERVKGKGKTGGKGWHGWGSHTNKGISQWGDKNALRRPTTKVTTGKHHDLRYNCSKTPEYNVHVNLRWIWICIQLHTSESDHGFWGWYSWLWIQVCESDHGFRSRFICASDRQSEHFATIKASNVSHPMTTAIVRRWFYEVTGCRRFFQKISVA